MFAIPAGRRTVVILVVCQALAPDKALSTLPIAVQIAVMPFVAIAAGAVLWWRQRAVSAEPRYVS